MYYPRLIDSYLKEWALRPTRKPLLLRGARQVGKSTAVRENFGTFTYTDTEEGAERTVRVCPLFALSQIRQ